MDDLVSYLKTVDTPTVSNAIELLDVRGRSENFAPYWIRCLYPELGPMVGYAVTLQMETVTQMEPYDMGQTIAFYEALDDIPKPAVIVMQEIGGFSEFAGHSGEVMSTVTRNFGAIGLVTDCCVRDFNEVRALGYHYFARGTVASHSYGRIARVGGAVQLGGMVVRHGDLLHGDLNGLVEVPLTRRAELPQMVDRVRSSESALMNEVRAGGFTLDRLREILTAQK